MKNTNDPLPTHPRPESSSSVLAIDNGLVAAMEDKERGEGKGGKAENLDQQKDPATRE